MNAILDAFPEESKEQGVWTESALEVGKIRNDFLKRFLQMNYIFVLHKFVFIMKVWCHSVSRRVYGTRVRWRGGLISTIEFVSITVLDSLMIILL